MEQKSAERMWSSSKMKGDMDRAEDMIGMTWDMIKIGTMDMIENMTNVRNGIQGETDKL